MQVNFTENAIEFLDNSGVKKGSVKLTNEALEFYGTDSTNWQLKLNFSNGEFECAGGKVAFETSGKMNLPNASITPEGVITGTDIRTD